MNDMWLGALIAFAGVIVGAALMLAVILLHR